MQRYASLQSRLVDPDVVMPRMKRFAKPLATMLVAAALASCAAPVEIAAPFVPTAPSVVVRMLEIAKVGPNDFVVDLGSGDGRIVITAAKEFGARGFGVDIDADLVAQARANARAAGVGDRAEFFERDLFATDLSPATVVTIYLLSRAMMKLRPMLYELKPGTRIVANAGSMGDWKPDYFEMMDVKDKVREDAPRKTYIHLWVVPARVAGKWEWSLPFGGRMLAYQLDASQAFQMLSATVRVDGKEVKVSDRLDGERMRLEFTADIDGKPVSHTLIGRVAGDTLRGSAQVGGQTLDWKASRVASQ
jgi:protein-L-isoaspartate O-methyltransferase